MDRLRLPPAPGPLEPDVPRAAVAAIFGPEDELLFIQRAERAGDVWSGHMAFPGGRAAAADASLVATAVRETREEVGIDLERHGTLLAELPELDAIARGRRAGLLITPFVFALEREAPLVFDPVEVAEALWAPFGALARREDAGTMAYAIEGR